MVNLETELSRGKAGRSIDAGERTQTRHGLLYGDA
jgi:hypothetical protein